MCSGKILVFGKKGMYSGNKGCIRTKWLFSGKSGFIQEELLYWAKFLVFGQSGCIREKVAVIR